MAQVGVAGYTGVQAVDTKKFPELAAVGKEFNVAIMNTLEERCDLTAQSLHETLHGAGIEVPEAMGGADGAGITVVVSFTLGNASHNDADLGRCASVFTERFPGVARDWRFVVPDVAPNGLVIELAHGVLITWEGAQLRHCTSVTIPGSVGGVDNTTYGAFVGVSKAAASRMRSRSLA